MAIDSRQQPEYDLCLHKGQSVFIRGNRTVQEFQNIGNTRSAIALVFPRRRNWNRRIIANWKGQPWRLDSNKRVSGEPGAIQPSLPVFIGHCIRRQFLLGLQPLASIFRANHQQGVGRPYLHVGGR